MSLIISALLLLLQASLLCNVFIPSVVASEQSDLVDAHNAARSAVGVPGLVWDNTVAQYAARWTATLRDQRNCAMEHSQGGPYGENLYKWPGGGGFQPPPATDAVRLWVSERMDYDPNSNTCRQGKVCGHYTQVVWRNSRRVGCASVRCNGNALLVSCNYDPPGNYVGQRPY